MILQMSKLYKNTFDTSLNYIFLDPASNKKYV